MNSVWDTANLEYLGISMGGGEGSSWPYRPRAWKRDLG